MIDLRGIDQCGVALVAAGGSKTHLAASNRDDAG
jgi:hypothetical protein